jgi:hypothetical protein
LFCAFLAWGHEMSDAVVIYTNNAVREMPWLRATPPTRLPERSSLLRLAWSVRNTWHLGTQGSPRIRIWQMDHLVCSWNVFYNLSSWPTTRSGERPGRRSYPTFQKGVSECTVQLSPSKLACNQLTCMCFSSHVVASASGSKSHNQTVMKWFW